MATSPQGDANVRLAHETEELTHSRYMEARASLLPALDGSVAEQNQTVNPRALGLIFESPLVTVPNSVGPFSTFDARVRLNQNVLNFNAIRQWQGSRADMRAARYETESVRARVAGAVARLYAAVLRADGQAAMLKAAIRDTEALRDLSSHRASVGEGTELDVTRAELSVAHARQRALTAETERVRTMLELIKVLNLDWNTTLRLSDKLDSAVPEPPGPSESMSLALQSRPDFRMQENRIESARLYQSATKLERAPSIVAYGDYGVLEGVQTHTVGVALRVPLFDGDRIKSDQIKAASFARQEEIRHSELRREVELQIRKALASLDAASQEVHVAEQGITLATEEVGRARRRYDAGLTNNLEVIDAETQLEITRADRISALFDRANARIDWALATGTIMSIVF
jgi:outer membrane protein TolC